MNAYFDGCLTCISSSSIILTMSVNEGLLSESGIRQLLTIYLSTLSQLTGAFNES